MRVLTGFPVRAATLVSIPDCTPTMPIDFVKNESRARRARKLGVADWKIRVTFDRVRTMSGVALIGHNLSGTAQMRIRIWPDPAKALTPFDSGWQYINPLIPFGEFPWGEPLGQTLYDDFHVKIGVDWFAAVAASVMEIDITDPYNPDGYHEIGVLFSDDYLTFKPAFDGTMAFETDTVQKRTVGASLRADRGSVWRSYEGELTYMPEAERSAWVDLQRKHDLAIDLFVSIFAERGGKLERDNHAQMKFIELARMASKVPFRSQSRYTLGET